jgi:hypothetical protein
MRKILVSFTMLLWIGLAACAAQPEPAEEISSDDAVAENVAESSEAIGQCGSGLYCYWTAYKGTTACLNNNQTVYCCPQGFASAGGSCLPICGSGLSCGYNSLWPSGSNICTQNNGNQNPVYCCAPGKTFTPNGCL